MTEDQVRGIVNSMLADAQYNVTDVPYHVHNGIDSPKIASQNLPNGVSSIIPGTNVTISPSNGVGDVTINSSNGGVTKIIAGSNISLSPSGGTGDVTITASASGGTNAGAAQFTVPHSTLADSTSSHDFGFTPLIVFGTMSVNGITLYMAIWMSSFEQSTSIVSDGKGDSSVSFLGSDSSFYLKNLSVSGTVLTWHYKNTGISDGSAYLYAIG